MTKALVEAAHRALRAQSWPSAPTDLIVSEPDEIGRVQIEGTVDLSLVVQALLAAQTVQDIDGPMGAPLPEGGREFVRLIVTGSGPDELDRGMAGNFPTIAAQQVEKALSQFWGAIDWKAAPVEPAA